MAKLVNRTIFMAKIKDKNLVLFSGRDVQTLFRISKVSATFLLHRYSKQGFIVKIRRGLYSLSDNLPPELYLANKLYDPSYISREFALSYHGVIPDMVYEITSVSTRDTRKFNTMGKIYSYRRIKKAAFTGYVLEKQKNFSFRIADPEKAFVDTLYYRTIFGKKPISRFKREKINKDKALKYAFLFKNPKLVGVLTRALN